MRENSRVGSQRFVLSLDAKGVLGVLAVAAVALGGAYLAGQSSARGAAHAEASPVAGDALSGLDRPLGGRDEGPMVMNAPGALVSQKPLDAALPVQPVRVAPPAAGADEELPPPPAVGSAPEPLVARAAPAAPAPAPRATDPEEAAATAPVHAAPPSAARPAAHGRYTIQVGSASRRSDAERLAHRLAGRSPRIAVADVPGKGRWYRVQIGSFESQDAARRQLTTLQRAGVHGIVTALR